MPMSTPTPTSATKRDLEAKLSVLEESKWDSSDDDDDEAAVESEKPTTKKEKGKKKKVIKGTAAAEDEASSSNVIYLGHIPANFEEAELRGFLGQFGQVTRLKLSRSRKTATSRGFGFVEFHDVDVAAVVADTMSGYLMGEKRIVCHIVPQDKIRPDLFKGSDRVFKRIDWAGLHRKKVNAHKSAKKMKVITQRLVNRESKKRDKLKKLGISYDFPGYKESNKAFPVQDRAPKEEIDLSEDNSGKETKSSKKLPTEKRERKLSNAELSKDKKKRRKMSNDEDAAKLTTPKSTKKTGAKPSTGKKSDRKAKNKKS